MDRIKVPVSPLWRTLVLGHMASHGWDIPYRLYLILMLSGVFFIQTELALPQVAAHEVEHGHHQAGTHSDPLCAWLCMAGQAVDVSPQHDAVHCTVGGAINSAQPGFRPVLPPAQTFSRGPPSKV